MSIRNIRRAYNNSDTPTDIFRLVNGEKKLIKRVYKVINGKPVIVWDIGNEIIIKIKNETTTVQKISVLCQFLYGKQSTVDWGDGNAITNIPYNSKVSHEYAPNSTHTIRISIVGNEFRNIPSQFLSGSTFMVKSVLIPSASITWIDKNALSKLSLVENIDFGKQNGLTSIGDYALAYNTNIQSITIPSSQFFGDYILAYCSALKTINFADDFSYESIPSDFAFYCTSLETVNLATPITKIGYKAFENCVSLQNINLSNVSGFGSYCFSNCLALTTVTIAGGGGLGQRAFSNCVSLNNVTINAPRPSFSGDYIFPDALQTIKFNGTKAEFSKDLSWVNYEGGSWWDATTLKYVVCIDGILTVGTDGFLVD